MAKISVIIPVYNVERYLRQSLDSVRGQTFTDLEIICVDDGSTDRSSAILADYVAQDGRFKVVRQENQGLSAARNAGLRQATGRYVYFLDSDDWIIPHALSRLHEVAERDNLDLLVFTCRSLVDECPAEKSRCSASFDMPSCLCGTTSDGATLLARLVRAGAYRPSVPFKFFRRDELLKANLTFPVGILHEDVFFTPLAFVFARRAEALNEALYVRRVRSGSIMTSDDQGADRRRLANAMVVHVRLGGGLRQRNFSRRQVDAVELARGSLLRYLVKGICQKHTSIRSAYAEARRKVLPGEGGMLFILFIRLVAKVAFRRLREEMLKKGVM